MLAQVAGDVDEALEDARRRRRVRMEDGRRAHPGAQARRRGAHLHAQPQRRDGGDSRRSPKRRARCRRTSSCSTARRSPSRVGGRPHAFQTTMRRFGRKLDVAPTAAGAADARLLLRLSAARRREPGRTPARERFAAPRGQRAAAAMRFRGWSRARARAARVLRRSAGARATKA